jgi:hypothetical protein
MDQPPNHLSAPPPSYLVPEVLPAEPLVAFHEGHSTITYQLPEGNSPEAIRARVKLLRQITERCYMRLARDLWEIYQLKLYIKYGHSTFDDYVASEVGISKDRSYKLRRIFSVLVLKCDIRPSEIEVADRSRVELILPYVNRNNAREWLSAAKTLPYKSLKNRTVVERAKRKKSRPGATAPDTPEITTPVRLACESPRAPDEGLSTEYVQRTFRLPDDADTLLNEALGAAQRVTGSHSDNFNLACIAQQFLAHNLTVEGKDDGRRGYFQRWMEEIYGGRFLHIRSDEAWAVLADAVEKHPHLFGIGEREEENGNGHDNGSDNDSNDDNGFSEGEGETDS